MTIETDIWARLDALAKPKRSLGKLEELAVRIGRIQKTPEPVVRPRCLVLFAADHGVVASGVSAWGPEVTALMVRTIVSGRSTSAAFAGMHQCDLRIVDVGVSTPLDDLSAPNFARACIARGTRDLSKEPAMTTGEFDAAWNVGVREAQAAIENGYKVLIAGEMGIGNTTAAACLTSLLAEVSAEQATGRGAGADDAILRIKKEIVAEASAKARKILRKDARKAIASVAGFEMAAMGGFFAESARHDVVVLVDGYVATAAALIAATLQSDTAACMVASHLSSEPGHSAALAALGLRPLLDWNMRLGEGTGALIALPLLDSAVSLLRDVVSLDELGVPRED